MKIETEVKYDFSDVLIRPKRSTLNSRSEVDLTRTMKFKYSPLEWTGVPIIAANMDTIGTFDVYDVLRRHKIVTALHKFYTKDDYKAAKEKYIKFIVDWKRCLKNDDGLLADNSMSWEVVQDRLGYQHLIGLVSLVLKLS